MNSTAALNKQYGTIAQMAIFVVYWLVMWNLESIDYVARPPSGPLATVTAPIVAAVPEQLHFFLELFSWRVLRHLVPFVLGWMMARAACLALIRDLYDLPHTAAAQLFLQRSQSGGASGELIPIRRKEFKKDRLQRPVLRYGGPGRILVRRGDVVWTERNGRFQRVLGPGTHTLARYEYVCGVLDVRVQERRRQNIRLITKDGIELRTDIVVTYHIGRGEKRPTEREPFPYDDEAVYLAGYAETLLPDGHVDDWETLPLAMTIAKLRRHVGDRTLDTLLFRDNLALKPHEIIKEHMERDSREALRRRGIDLVGTRLSRLEVPDPVTRQRIAYWQSHWRRRHVVDEAEGKAGTLVELEGARAEAKAAAIGRLLEGIKAGRRAMPQGSTREVMALRLVDALEQMAGRAATQVADAHESAAELPARIEEIRHRLEEENSPAEWPGPTSETFESRDREDDADDSLID